MTRLVAAVAAYLPAVRQPRNPGRCTAAFLELQAAWTEAQTEGTGRASEVSE